MTSLTNLLGSGATSYESVSVNATADGDNTLIAAVAGKQIWVVSYMLAGTAAGTVLLEDTNDVEKARIRVGGDGGGASFGGPLAFIVDAGAGLRCTNPAGVDVFGHILFARV